MPWQLKLLSGVAERLQAAEQGLLVVSTDVQEQTATVVGSVPVTSGDFTRAVDAITSLLPQGLVLAGSYSAASSSVPWQPSSNKVSATVAATNSAHAASWTVNGQAVEAVTIAAESRSSDDSCLHFVPGFIALRCHLDVQLNIQHSSNSNSNGSNNIPATAIQAAVQQLEQQLFNPQLVCVSELSGQQQQQQQVLISSSCRSSIQDVLGNLLASSSSSCPCISLLPLHHTGSNGSISRAPIFGYDPQQQQQQQQQQQLTSLTLGLDIICCAPATMPAAEVLHSLVKPGLDSQLSVMQQQLQQQAAAGQSLTPIRAYHYQPPSLGNLSTTICYPMLEQSLEATEVKLTPVRQQLHKLLGLPDNVPMLRFSNALSWAAAAADGDGQGVPRTLRLRNVHEGLTPPGFGGQLYLIDGHYEYYHYMQDKFNDNGWGCAYRSLQTIISWFKLQKYASKPIPTHRQIQEILVKLGDKEASFVGSSNWIGAIELSYILDEHLGITSKVVTVNRGSEIPNKARALAQHFATQGTPVMIGGGVLAYTLLGVCFNEDTGEAAFLILDPHYTGGEDLKKIHQGTWVSWKQLGDNAAAGGPLFVKDAFYNFLCPQRPRTV